MPHPVTRCPTAARLYQLVLNLSSLHNGTPEVLRGPAIEAERREHDWQVAWTEYQKHIQNCIVCRNAIKEDEKGIP